MKKNAQKIPSWIWKDEMSFLLPKNGGGEKADLFRDSKKSDETFLQPIPPPKLSSETSTLASSGMAASSVLKAVVTLVPGGRFPKSKAGVVSKVRKKLRSKRGDTRRSDFL